MAVKTDQALATLETSGERYGASKIYIVPK